MTQTLDSIHSPHDAATEMTQTINSCFEKACTLIAPVWPLKTAIACNPLLHLETKDFWQALADSQKHFYQKTSTQDEVVNSYMITWLQAFLDDHVATLKMPFKELGFFECFLKLIAFDKTITSSPQKLKLLLSIPKQPQHALSFLVQKLKLNISTLDELFKQQLSSLQGWAGYIRWYSQWQDQKKQKYKIDLKHFLAARLALHLVLFGKLELSYQNSSQDDKGLAASKKMMIESEEKRFFTALYHKLFQTQVGSSLKKTPACQFVFCIDVRSEPMRAAIEAQNHYQTYGFAGFFGIPVSFQSEDYSWASCPVLLKPSYSVKAPFSLETALTKSSSSLFKNLKFRFGTAFSLVETIGVFSGVWMAVKTWLPSLAKKMKFSSQKVANHCLDSELICFSDKVTLAENALNMMGFGKTFAEVVVFCGHMSQSTNNPHASALDCGACGGHRGGLNAQLLSSILNEKSVRQALHQKGLSIPSSTIFIGAEHNTVTDEITLFDKHNFAYDFSSIELDLKKAQSELQQKKKKTISSHEPSHDWACVRPEWGLAKNGAFIVGPRDKTFFADLEGRCFLHSYDASTDSDGRFLETILTAPMVVAEWINTQYFFSTYDPVAYGSGSKVTHTIVGGFGVMQGNGSDLMHGLPLESLYESSGKAYHELIRLHVVVYAPKERVEMIIQKHDILKKLFFGQWVKLFVIEDSSCFQLSTDCWWNHVHV